MLRWIMGKIACQRVIDDMSEFLVPDSWEMVRNGAEAAVHATYRKFLSKLVSLATAEPQASNIFQRLSAAV